MRCAIAALAVLALAAPAVAAPARTGVFDADHLSYGWSFGPATGVFGDALIADKAPCTTVAQTCDLTLLQVTGEDLGTLAVSTSTADQTVVDLDIRMYTSDAQGAQGDLIAEGDAFSPAESVATDVDPGYYLVKVMYMTGAGSYAGAATFTPAPPEEEVPE
jgi:hypothetical protein